MICKHKQASKRTVTYIFRFIIIVHNMAPTPISHSSDMSIKAARAFFVPARELRNNPKQPHNGFINVT